MIKENLIASTPRDEPKCIIIGKEYFASIVQELDLARNYKAYILVPEEDRFNMHYNVTLNAPGTISTMASLLQVKLYHSSSWDKHGKYDSKYFNLLHVTNNHTKTQYHKDTGEEGSDGFLENLYEGNREWQPITNYASVIEQYKTHFGVSYLRKVDGAKLQVSGAFKDSNPRPYGYKVSAVHIKDSGAYVLVLDTILHDYLSKGVVPSKYKPIPVSSIVPGEYESMDLEFFYDVKHGKGTFKALQEELLESKDYLVSKIWPHVVRADKEFRVSPEPIKLENKVKVYSDKPNPEMRADLSFTEKQYSFTLGYYGSLPVITILDEQDDIYSLLERAQRDPEIYRIFSHNDYHNTAKGFAKKYILDTEIKLYIKEFSHFDFEGRYFPIKSIPRHKEWEPASTPEIPRELLEQEGNAIDKAIQYYLETGIGISYWNFRVQNAN